MLPPQVVGAAEVVARLDGVMIRGGRMSIRSGTAASRTPYWRSGDRDAWEWALLDAADAAGLPAWESVAGCS